MTRLSVAPLTHFASPGRHHGAGSARGARGRPGRGADAGGDRRGSGARALPGPRRHTSLPATSSSSTTRPPSPRSSTRCCAVAAPWSCTRRPGSTTAPGWSSCAPPRTPRAPSWTPQAGDELDLPGRRPAHPARALPARRSPRRPVEGNRLWRAAVSGPRPLEQHLVRYGRPIAYGYLDRRYPLSAYQTVFAHAARQRRDAQCRKAVHPRAGHRPGRHRHRGRRHHPAHRGVLAGGRRGAAARVVRGVGDGGPARQRDAWPGGGRVVAVGTTVTRALESAQSRTTATATRSSREVRVDHAGRLA